MWIWRYLIELCFDRQIYFANSRVDWANSQETGGSMSKKNTIIVALVTFCLTATLFSVLPTWSTQVYDPWADVSGPTAGVPDGRINMRDIAYEVSLFGTAGTPIDRAHAAFLEYDSGWMDTTGECGQYFNVTHNLNNSDFMVGIEGRAILGGAVHQQDYGLKEIAQGWNKTYGGPSSVPHALIKTTDGGYAFAGSSASDFWLVKIDAPGNMQWSQMYGTPYMNEAYALVQTNDGGYALAGSYSYTVPNPDRTYYYVWFVKTDAAGNMRWNQTYARTGNNILYALVQTTDGGYALTGAGFWLIKTDASGNMQWNQSYGGSDDDEAYALVQTDDGGYALAGRTSSFGAGGRYNFWLVKTDASGNMQWNKTYGGGGWAEAFALVKTNDEGYALAGGAAADGTMNAYFWLVKTDASGNMQWNRTYVNAATSMEAYALVQTSDGGYALAGYTNGLGLYDFGFVKTDQNGNAQLYEEYGQGTAVDIAYGLVQATDGGYVLAGYSAGNAWLIKTGAESGLAWVNSTVNTITLYRGLTDVYWNYVRVYIWKSI